MSAQVKAALLPLAQSLGFAVCRVAACGPPLHAGEFDTWLDSDYDGEMAWMRANRERRTDPQKVLPGARAVIVLGMNYFQGSQTVGDGGRIARYAWGEDYHDLIEKRLLQISSFLSEQGGTQKCYVDTGPILERDFAAQAGVGWHGKSTMLIHPELGTWFFLAEILTTLPTPRGPTNARPLRELHALYDSMSDECHRGPACRRCASMHLLSHHRTKRKHPRGIAAADR